MPSFIDIPTGKTPAAAADIQQVIDALKGTSGKGIPLSPTAVADGIAYAVSVKNIDGTNSRAGIFYGADGNPLLSIDKNGVQASAYGANALSPVVTTSATQTLANKTLTSPHSTTPVVDSGGLTITAGGLTVTAGGLAVNAGNVGVGGAPVAAQALTITQGVSGANAYGIRHSGVLTATAANATLAALSLEPTMNPNGQSNVLEAGLSVPTWNATSSANAYAAKLVAPTGSAGVNEALNTSGAVTHSGLGTFAASDKYLVVDSSGHVHVSALGPAS